MTWELFPPVSLAYDGLNSNLQQFHGCWHETPGSETKGSLLLTAIAAVTDQHFGANFLRAM